MPLLEKWWLLWWSLGSLARSYSNPSWDQRGSSVFCQTVYWVSLKLREITNSI